MKRMIPSFSPIQRRRLSTPLNLIIFASLDQFWVWCLSVDHLLKRQRSRFGLESLTAEQLNDIGLTREDVEKELGKQFWQE